MIKLITALVLSVLLLLFVVQNLHQVELHFLFWQFNGSLALILALTFIISIIISILVAIPYSIKKRKTKSEAKSDQLPAIEESKKQS